MDKKKFTKDDNAKPKFDVNLKIEGKAVEQPKPKDRNGKITDYDVVQEPKIEDFKRVVRQHIKAGWAPVGGASYCERMGHWYQALIFRDL